MSMSIKCFFLNSQSTLMCEPVCMYTLMYPHVWEIQIGTFLLLSLSEMVTTMFGVLRLTKTLTG